MVWMAGGWPVLAFFARAAAMLSIAWFVLFQLTKSLAFGSAVPAALCYRRESKAWATRPVCNSHANHCDVKRAASDWAAQIHAHILFRHFTF
jgi:hypothetical protein